NLVQAKSETYFNLGVVRYRCFNLGPDIGRVWAARCNVLVLFALMSVISGLCFWRYRKIKIWARVEQPTRRTVISRSREISFAWKECTAAGGGRFRGCHWAEREN